MAAAVECPLCPPGHHVTNVDHVDREHPELPPKAAFNFKEWLRRRRL